MLLADEVHVCEQIAFAVIAVFAGVFFLIGAPEVETTLFFILLGVFCLATGMVAMTKFFKTLGIALGSTLFGAGIWFLFQAITDQGGEPNSWNSVIGAVAFVTFLGLPGLAYAWSNRFGLPTREERALARRQRRAAWKTEQIVIGDVAELLDRDYVAAKTDAKRLNIMNEILRKYAAYHKKHGMDTSTWSRVAAILESDYEIHRQFPGGRPRFPDNFSFCPGVDWVINFKGTVRDLLRDEQEKRQQAVSVLELLWGSAAILGIAWTISAWAHDYKPLQHIVAVIYLNVFYTHAIMPLLIRWKIRRELTTQLELDIKVDIEGFQIKTTSAINNRKWSDLSKIRYGHLGIVFRWVDGTKDWLPKSVTEKISGFRIEQRT